MELSFQSKLGPSSPMRSPLTPRRRRCFVFAPLAFSVLFCSQRILAFTPPGTSNRPRPRICLAASTSTSTSLESLTVRELRQLVKDSTNERGLLSRLKRKQDLVDYLQDKLSENGQIAVTKATEQVNGSPPQKKKTPLKMPSVTTKTESSISHSPTSTSPKDAIFERVYQRYPPVRDMASLNQTFPAEDVRQIYHPIFRENNVSSDMDIVFVGTASCTPGITRGVSCTALRLNWRRRAAFLNPKTGRMEQMSNFQGGTWLFDVGECTQLQIQRTASVRPSKITKIFLTHAHGDHSFGLPGLLCLMGPDRDRENSPPVEIYGPEGLRMWLRVAIRYSVSRIVPPYRVHEIMEVPMAPEWEFSERAKRFFYRGRRRGTNGDTPRWGNQGLSGEDPTSWISQANMMHLEPSPLYGEIEGGRNIYPIYDHPLSSDGAPVWEVEDEEDVKVYAAPMSHGIPCLGYMVEELPRPGRLRNDFVEPIVKRNVAALREAGFGDPMKAMAVIKNLPIGSAFTFPDGTVVTQEEAVEPPRQGRKVVLCGDTADSRAMRKLAENADVVIHEATNSYLQGVDRDTDIRAVNRDAIIHGHSTPQIAGEFARSAKAKRLILNHFSARYKGDVSVDSLSIMMRIEKQAMRATGLNETQVAAAWDLMILPIPQH